MADRIVRRRLATAVQAGGALVSASASQSLQRHIVDQLAINFVARAGQTRAALDQLFAILNDLRATPPRVAATLEVVAAAAGLRVADAWHVEDEDRWQAELVLATAWPPPGRPA